MPKNINRELYPKFYLYRRIVQAKLFIDDNYSKKIDLNNIAGSAFFSKYHFIRLFKNAYKKTPHQYLIQVRIQNAKQFLKDNMAIIDVCYSVGFESLSSFTDLFRRTAGLTPAAYRTQQQKRKADISMKPFKFIPDCFANSIMPFKKRNFQEDKSNG